MTQITPAQRRALSRARKPWLEVIDDCQKVAYDLGLSIELRDPRAPHWQICLLTKLGVRIVVYPYRANRSHQFPRARDENSQDKQAADEVMRALAFHVRNKPWFSFPNLTPAGIALRAEMEKENG